MLTGHLYISFEEISTLIFFYKSGYFLAFNSVPLISMSILIPIPNYLGYHSFVLTSKIKKCESSNFVLDFQDGFFSILNPLCCHMNVRIHLSNSAQKDSLDFDRNCTEYVNQFGEYCHVNNVVF